MKKSEQVNFLLEMLTKYDTEPYEEIKSELLKNGVDFSKIPQEKLAFASKRFLADLKAKEKGHDGAYIVTPPQYARSKLRLDTLCLADVAAEIFCHISREYAGICTYEKLFKTIQIVLQNGQKFIVTVEQY